MRPKVPRLALDAVALHNPRSEGVERVFVEKEVAEVSAPV